MKTIKGSQGLRLGFAMEKLALISLKCLICTMKIRYDRSNLTEWLWRLNQIIHVKTFNTLPGTLQILLKILAIIEQIPGATWCDIYLTVKISIGKRIRTCIKNCFVIYKVLRHVDYCKAEFSCAPLRNWPPIFLSVLLIDVSPAPRTVTGT